MSNTFKPYHMNVTPDDLIGNQTIGRYLFLPGSNGRAKEIAEQFEQVSVKTHPRGHHLYTGILNDNGRHIDVAVMPTGMGCGSMEIILHELLMLGGRRFLRVGTAGSLQPELIKIGDLINTQASVRDEATTLDYAPLGVPAVASIEMIEAISQAAKNVKLQSRLFTGTVHCKSSFYAREFGEGPKHDENEHYIKLLTNCNVLATEMETATLFIQSQVFEHQLMKDGGGKSRRVIAGALLGILSDSHQRLADSQESKMTTERLITVAIETIKVLSANEMK